jgi:hypothetical protein
MEGDDVARAPDAAAAHRSAPGTSVYWYQRLLLKLKIQPPCSLPILTISLHS